ncbi:CLIP domain-containing serine protease [Halocaridina rubra]|uniref:CLIP domain-containing serine protease n=1 Tax=Halocaridina rubra TaxID=373956 RepID=A0AAN8WFH6_HALRR
MPLASGHCPVGTHECVPFYQCVNGVINTSGIGIINIRYRPVSECRATTATGEPGVCCKIPDGSKPPTSSTSTPPSGIGGPVYTCPSDQVCVIKELCDSNGNPNTDGSGLIDIRGIIRLCHLSPVQQLGILGVCCNEPSTTVNTCPANYGCVPTSSCKGKALTNNNDYAPYSFYGSWTKCRLPGSLHYEGICCETSPTQPSPLLPATHCGVRNTGLIVRSHTELKKSDTQFGEFPWQAVIFHTNYTFKCGGSLIAKDWVITGAHCVHGSRPTQLRIRLGEWKVDKEDEPLSHKDFDIDEIKIHPNFNPDNLHNDIALIKLKTSVTFQYHINTLCLPESNQPVAPGTRCFASGWGKDAFKGQYQALLKKIDVPVIDQGKCQYLLKKTRLGSYFNLHDSFLCAGGEQNKDACRGDGGGPLVCQRGNTGYYYLAGITAWGIDCGQKDVPGVYVNVPHFLDWIQGIIFSTGFRPYG